MLSSSRKRFQIIMTSLCSNSLNNPLLSRVRCPFSSYRIFAQRVMQISKTASHTQKKAVFNGYFQDLNQNERQSIKNIFNFVEAKPKTGIATKSVCKHLIEYYKIQNCSETDTDLIATHLGEQVEDIGTNSIELEDLQKILKELMTKEGKGSRDYKLDLIHQFIEKAVSVEEITVFLRLITKKLRMGATEKLIGLNEITRESSKYQQQNDPQQLRKNVDDLTRFDPMLARPLKNLEEFEKFCNKKQCGNLVADLKYDGQRSLIVFKRGNKLQMVSRRNKPQAQTYKPFALRLQNELLSIQGLESIQLDGQIVCVGENEEPIPMQKLLCQRGKQEILEDKQKMLFYAFDILELNSQSLLQKPLEERLLLLPKKQTIRKSDSKTFKYPEQKEKLLDYFIKLVGMKYQGLIIKGTRDKYYTNGTRKHWGKLKKGFKLLESDAQQMDLDLVVMGVDYGQGNRSRFFGSFLLGVYDDGKYHAISKVGTGFSQQQMKQFTSYFQDKIIKEKPENYVLSKSLRPPIFVKPQVVFEVSCQEVTRSSVYNFSFRQGYGGLSLRFPVFKRLRDDKSPEDCNADTLLDLAEKIQ